MNACEWAERVALSVDEADADAEDRHVATCEECRQLLGDLHVGRELMAEAPSVPESAYDEVRARVLERVRPSRLRWAIAAAVAFAVFGASMWVNRQLQAPREPLRAVQTEIAPPLPDGHGSVVRRIVERRVTERRVTDRRVTEPRPSGSVQLALALREMLAPASTAPVAAAGPVVMSMQTEDPNVLIVLVPESKGDAE